MYGSERPSGLSAPAYLTVSDIEDNVSKAETEWNLYMSRNKELHNDYAKEFDFITKEPNLQLRKEGILELINRPKYRRHFKQASELYMKMTYWRERAQQNGVSISTNLANSQDAYWLEQIMEQLPGNPNHEKTKRQVFLMGGESISHQGGGFRKRSSTIKINNNPLGGANV